MGDEDKAKVEKEFLEQSARDRSGWSRPRRVVEWSGR
jgi:hypothetical protein